MQVGNELDRQLNTVAAGYGHHSGEYADALVN